MNFEEEIKSRSQKKRESTAVQKLGENLVQLSEKTLKHMDLPSDLLESIIIWKGTSTREAKRRQMQFIGRVMRELDTQVLAKKLEGQLEQGHEETKNLHSLENLRDELIATADSELEGKLKALTEIHTTLEYPKLKHLVTMAKQEKENLRPPKMYRELFRYLKNITP